MPPLSIQNTGERQNPLLQTHSHKSIHACSPSPTHTSSPNTHQLLGQRKIYISSENLRCLCTRWVCLSLGLTPVAHLIRMLCVCVHVCVYVLTVSWGFEKRTNMAVRECGKCGGVRAVGAPCQHPREAKLELSTDQSMLSHHAQSLSLIDD